MKDFLKNIKNVFCLVICLILICGIGYPLLITGLGQTLFPHEANGSIVEVDGKKVGSKLIGQDFSDPKFMKCRPSAVSYNTYSETDKENGTYTGVASGSNNYGPSNEELLKRVQGDIDSFLERNPSIKKEDIPTDLLTSSGSGLDPHISPASAKVQIPAISTATGISEKELTKIVDENTTDKLLGTFGEKTVNVLLVNLEISKRLKN